MYYDIKNIETIVFAKNTDDVLKVKFSIDEDDIIENLDISFLGPIENEIIINRINDILWMSINEAIELEYDDFINDEDNLQLGVMIVNSIREMAVKYYKNKLNLEEAIESDGIIN